MTGVKTIKKTIIIILSLILAIEVAGLIYLTTVKSKPAAPKIDTTQRSTSEKPLAETDSSTTASSETNNRLPVEKWLASETEISFPILMYHSLSEGNSLKIPPAEFRQHMMWLKEQGYYTLTPEEAQQVLTLNKKPAEKIVWITFDDGYLNNYTEGFPILKELELNATINYIVAKEGSDNYFNMAQMKEMSESKLISIQSHTMNHLEVNVMPYEQQFSEMKESKDYFDQQLNQETIALCYPAGRYDTANFATAADAGYKLAVTTEPGYAKASDGLFALKRVRVSPGYDGLGFGNLLQSFN